MRHSPRSRTYFSRVSSKGWTVIPPEVRVRLGIRPGDTLGYQSGKTGVWLHKIPRVATADPVAIFSEWSSAADERSYKRL